jgi:hypothetical protein
MRESLAKQHAIYDQSHHAAHEQVEVAVKAQAPKLSRPSLLPWMTCCSFSFLHVSCFTNSIYVGR